MNDALEFYSQQAQAFLSPRPWLAQRQKEALATFKRQGFPTRSQEDWKYNNLEPFIHEVFTPKIPLAPAAPQSLITLDSALIIQNNNGIISSDDHLPPGLIVLPLHQAIEQYEDQVKKAFNISTNLANAFHALNSAFLQTGLFIYLSPNLNLTQPLLIKNWQDQDQHALYCRNFVIAEEKSQGVIIEEYYGRENTRYLSNAVTEILVDRGAQVTHYKIQAEAKQSFHIGHIEVRQKAHSRFVSHILSTGGKMARTDILVSMEEEYASCLLNGIYLSADDQQLDHHTTIKHLVPHCDSEQDYKGIISDQSKAIFNGKILVLPDAQKTVARQQNKNLLLSSGCEINTKPQLEIFANDVICTHGTTVGQLDEDALFYLLARGLPLLQAKNMLIEAFLLENSALMDNTAISEILNRILKKQLEGTL